jgi:MoxR-like ATPase
MTEFLPLDGAPDRFVDPDTQESVGHVPDRDHLEAVNIAIAAQRPLLLRGDPGVGKSQLARYVAVVLQRPLVTRVVDARTEPRDLLYTFDAVARLAEAQLAGAAGLSPEEVRARLAPTNFVRPGPLWWAFHWKAAEEIATRHALSIPKIPAKPGQGSDAPTATWQREDGVVVLIDEIDKADPSVPNALLDALARETFDVDGVGVVARERAHRAPVILITTNEERVLPPAFLRRCLVLHMAMPSDLVARGKRHFPELDEALLKRAAEQLATDRRELPPGHPKPGQAEYLDLLRALKNLPPGTDLHATLDRVFKYAFRKHEPRERDRSGSPK